MTEREEIIEQIAAVEQRKADMALEAMQAVACGDDATADQCNASWDAAGDEIGRLWNRLDALDDDCDEARAHRRDAMLGFLDTWAMWW
jgi:hypothetical protein